MKPQGSFRERGECRPAVTLAHLSDPHLTQWSVDKLQLLFNKRLRAWLSWHLSGRRIHLRRILDSMLEDLSGQAPDHIVVTGDLVNLALPQEFENAARWLRNLGPPEKVTVIPGNHEAYVRVPDAEGIGRWHDYMRSLAWDSAVSTGVYHDRFPFVRRLGPIAIIGLSTAVPTPLLCGFGLLGQRQLKLLHAILAKLEGENTFRIVLIHHPPVQSVGSYRHRHLVDAEHFMNVVADAGAELVLHGHAHVTCLGRIGKTPIIGVPSASAVKHRYKDAAAYNLYRITHADRHWTLSVETRALSDDERRFKLAQHFTLEIPCRGA